MARALGTPLMPWQRLVCDVGTEVDPSTGLLAYREVILTVPRQSGKTTLMLSISTHRANAFGGRQNISYTAQTRNDARKKWEDDWLPILGASPFGGQFRVRLNNGHEGMRWRSGSHFDLTATTKRSGHGPTIDLGLADEAFAQLDSRIEQAMKPAMITRPQPQMWIISTAGDDSSLWLRDKVNRGRRLVEDGVTSGTAYFEWSAADDSDASDPATWWSCMPALGHTVTEAAIMAECQGMAEADFRRAYLNQWVAGGGQAAAIPDDLWADLRDRLVKVRPQHALGIAVAPDQSWSAIAGCGETEDGRRWVDVIAYRRGVQWLPERLAEIGRRGAAAVLVDPSSAAGALLPELRKAAKITEISKRDVAQACGSFRAAAMSRRIVHLGQGELTKALASAQTRLRDESWVWAPRTSSIDISPLVAATFAHWGWQKHASKSLTNNVW